MTKTKESAGTERRDFLRLAGLGTLAGAAAVTGAGRKVEAAAPQDAGQGGYRETAHVRKFYELSRF